MSTATAPAITHATIPASHDTTTTNEAAIARKSLAILLDTIADLAQDSFAVSQFIEQTIERFNDHPCEVYRGAVHLLRDELTNWT
jgi:hypothetical protein